MYYRRKSEKINQIIMIINNISSLIYICLIIVHVIKYGKMHKLNLLNEENTYKIFGGNTNSWILRKEGLLCY